MVEKNSSSNSKNKLTFVFAILTYNRSKYLKQCVNTWLKTRSDQVIWKVIISDDGSDDQTFDYLNKLRTSVDFTLIKCKRWGVHRSTNEIIRTLSNLEYDFCFVVNDDMQFIKKGWDIDHYNIAMKSGYHHLLFNDDNWAQSSDKITAHQDVPELISKNKILNQQGAFFTLSPNVVNQVGYFDAINFGFRGMGHLDYTIRCARAGFNHPETPFELKSSSLKMKLQLNNYTPSIDHKIVSHYDEDKRKEKEKIILRESRKYIEFQEANSITYTSFLIESCRGLIKENTLLQQQIIANDGWYKEELTKTKAWYTSNYVPIPKPLKLIKKIFYNVKS